MNQYPESVKQRARELRAQGLIYREIAAKSGAPLRTVYQWCTDPDGEKARARKQRYAGTCESCGARTTGTASGTGSRAVRWCRACAVAHVVEARGHRVWTRERIIEAARAWSAEHGRQVGAQDWNPSALRARGHDERADDFEADGRWPHVTTVQNHFDSWNAMIRAAGLDVIAPGQRIDVEAWREAQANRELVWTRDAVILAIQEWTEVHGRPPRSTDWLRAGDGHPTYLTVRRHFDSWAAALDAARDTEWEAAA